MDDLTREQSQTIVEGEPKESFILAGARAAPNWRPRSAGRLAATLLIVVFGLGAGWLAGRVLNRARSGSAFPPDTGAPQVDGSASTSGAQTNSRPRARVNSPEANSAVANPAESAANPAPVAEPEPAPKPPLVQEVPAPAPPRADKNDHSGGELPSEEQSARDTSRKAMRKILKETEKASRSTNDNDNRSEAEKKTNYNRSVRDKQNINENKNQNLQK
jgi:hypothetical protein